MPITVITGLPGHGKTLYTLATYRDVSARSGRPVYYRGIKDLALPWIEHDPEQWQSLPPTAILVIDEAQQVFPLRGRGSPPDWIEKLAVHRHAGIDLVLITQNPMLLDSFVRRLVDRHFHVVRKFGTSFATVHEFANGVNENVARSRSGSITHEWKYPKDVFALYKSAEVHTVKARIPARVWLFLSIPFLLAALVWVIWGRLQPESVGARTAAQVSRSAGPAGGVNRPGAFAAPAGGPGLSAAGYVEALQPRVPGLAYTAPAYDAVTAPVEAPYPAACLSSTKRACQCYTQQATRLEVPADLCEKIAAGGFFVAWGRRAADLPVQAGSAPSRSGRAQVVSSPVVSGLPPVPGDVGGYDNLRGRRENLPYAVVVR